jgi:hypothetical protein
MIAGAALNTVEHSDLVNVKQNLGNGANSDPDLPALKWVALEELQAR